MGIFSNVSRRQLVPQANLEFPHFVLELLLASLDLLSFFLSVLRPKTIIKMFMAIIKMFLAMY